MQAFFYFFLFIFSTKRTFGVHLAFHPPSGMSISIVNETAFSSPVRLEIKEQREPEVKSFSCATVTGYNYTIYHCLAPNLNASQEYIYQIIDANNLFLYGDKFQMVDASKKTIRIAQIGDMGYQQSENVIDFLNKNHKDFDMIIHAGDIGYADCKYEINDAPDYIPTWKQYFKMIANITAHTAYMVGPGNHDVTCHKFGDMYCPEELRNFSTYRNWFNMPNSVGPNLWYSFNLGPVHFTFINTESDFPGAPSFPGRTIGPGGGGFGNQLEWLENDLKNYHKELQPWLIVVGHRPLILHTTWDFPPFTTEHLRYSFGPLFEQYKVDAYVAGHIHAYERYPIINGTLHLVNGAGGSPEGVDTGFDEPDKFRPTPDPLKRILSFGWATMEISTTQFSWNFFTDNGTLADSVSLVK